MLGLESGGKHRLSLAVRFDCTEIIINQSFADSNQNPLSEWQVTIKLHLVVGSTVQVSWHTSIVQLHIEAGFNSESRLIVQSIHFKYVVSTFKTFWNVRIASPGSMQDTGCLGLVQWDDPRDGMGREVGGGFRMGNTCTPVADSCWCMAKSIQYCKV